MSSALVHSEPGPTAAADWISRADFAALLGLGAAIVYYDAKRMGAASLESAFLFSTFVLAWRSTWSAGAALSDGPRALLFVTLGLCLAGLERTLFGVLFHLPRSYEPAHLRYHTRLCQKIALGLYVRADDLFEVLSYGTVFGVWMLIFRGVLDPLPLRALFLGLTIEHLVGSRLRGDIQYNRGRKAERRNVPAEWASGRSRRGSAALTWRDRVARFKLNADLYYDWHLVMHPQMCAGFSSPFWDTLIGRNPFASRVPYIGSCPLPFFDFFFVDYSEHYEAVQEAWRAYRRDATALERTMLEGSLRWRAQRRALCGSCRRAPHRQMPGPLFAPTGDRASSPDPVPNT
jgi:hypothetical protein